MKRPLFIASLVITAIVFIYLELFLSEYLMDYSDSFDGSEIILSGIVTDKALKKDYLGNFTTVVYITPFNTSIGKSKYIALNLNADEPRLPVIGESVKVKGRVCLFSSARNPGEFDTRLYYATLKIAYEIKNAKILKRDGKENYVHEGLFVLRSRLERVLDSCLNYDDAAVMKAILLGDKAFMSSKVKELYKNNGIIHILAVSGLHISLIGMGLYRLLRKGGCKNFAASMTSIIIMYLYGQMCGMSSSAFRAVFMFAIRLLAPMAGRTYDMLSALAISEIMLLVDKPLLVYNSGFLFSFGAVLGIALVMPSLKLLSAKTSNPLKEKLRFADDPGEPLWKSVLEKTGTSLLVSISVFLVTLPVYMSFYYTYPVYSIFLNLIILPMMGPIMVIGMCMIPAGGLFPPLGTALGSLVHFILWIIGLLCNITGKIPGKTWFMGHAKDWKIWMYALLLCLFLLLWDIETDDGVIQKLKDKLGKGYEKHLRFMDTFRFSILAFALFVLIINPSYGLSITMMDVDQGDGILISKDGSNILIDGGSTGKKNVGKYSIIPFLKYQGIGTIDAAIITHEDQDHISGVLEIMDDMESGGIRISTLILPDINEKCRGENYHKLQERAEQLKIKVKYISCGQTVSFRGVSFLCINPAKNMITDGANAYSTVLLMKYGSFSALFTGDVEEEGQEHILKDLRANKELFKELTMLKVAHHGSMYTTNEEFLDILRPKIAVISCGRNNRYGHPHGELLRRLEEKNVKVYRTDKNGAISINVRKNRMDIRTMLSVK